MGSVFVQFSIMQAAYREIIFFLFISTLCSLLPFSLCSLALLFYSLDVVHGYILGIMYQELKVMLAL